MWCIGFRRQWPLDRNEVLYTLKSDSMVLRQKTVDCTLLVRKRRPQGRPRTHSRNHISDLALEGFGVLSAVLQRGRMGIHQNLGLQISGERQNCFYLHSTKSLRKWRIHLLTLLWFCLNQNPFVMCKTNEWWCHSVVEWCWIISELPPKNRNELCNSSAINSPGHIPLLWYLVC